VFLSRFDPEKIITVSQVEVEKYTIGPQIQFQNYSVLQLPDQRRFLLVDDQLREIEPEAFRNLGYHPEEIIEVQEPDLAGYTPGVAITIESAYPTGILLQDDQTGGVFYVDNSIRYPIVAREIMKTRYPRLQLLQVEPSSLDQYEQGPPVKFRDGELVKTIDENKVYVISEGQRRWITDGEVFTDLGYRWENIVTTSASALAVHSEGEALE